MRDAALITLILRDGPEGQHSSPDPARLAELLDAPRRVWVNHVDGTRTFLFEVEASASAETPREPRLGSAKPRRGRA